MRTLLVLFILIVTTYAYSQKKTQNPKSEGASPLYKSEQSKEIEELMKMRAEMMKQMQEHFMNDEFFSDSFMDSVLEDEGLASLSKSSSSLYESRWEENAKERILAIKPKRKDVPLDIKIKDQMVSIGAKETKKENGSQISSNFMNSFSVPDDVDANKAEIEQKGEEILVRLPRRAGSLDNKSKTGTKKIDDGTTPIKASPGDITI